VEPAKRVDRMFDLELWLGPHKKPGEELAELWELRRDELLARDALPGSRLWAFWHFDLREDEPREPDDAAIRLQELGLFRDEERAEVKEKANEGRSGSELRASTTTGARPKAPISGRSSSGTQSSNRGSVVGLRMTGSRSSRPDPGPVRMVVADGQILGWEMPSGEFVRPGENCCENPLECERCFGPVKKTWWARWRRRGSATE
jgi:hypothetical protein